MNCTTIVAVGRCFYKGYVLGNALETHQRTYLWHYSGQVLDSQMKEVHLYLQPEDYKIPDKQGKNVIRPCYLDIKNGFINFRDDSDDGKPNIRKLYYCNFAQKNRPQILTFPTCPHCRHQLSSSQITSFSTRGNQSFYNLIKTQFEQQPAVSGKDNDPERLPNEGRKVLLSQIVVNERPNLLVICQTLLTLWQRASFLHWQFMTWSSLRRNAP